MNLKNFYSYNRGDDIDTPKLYEFEVATQLFTDELCYFKDKFLKFTTSYNISIKNKMLLWILKKATTEFCFKYFHQWLFIAEEGAHKITVPDWEVLSKEQAELEIARYENMLGRFKTKSI